MLHPTEEALRGREALRWGWLLPEKMLVGYLLRCMLVVSYPGKEDKENIIVTIDSDPYATEG